MRPAVVSPTEVRSGGKVRGCNSDRCLCVHMERSKKREDLRHQLRPVTCGPGRVVYEQGEPATRCYWLCDGRVELVRWNRAGRRQIIHIVDPGRLFGLESLVGKRAYEHSADVLEESRILCFDRKETLIEFLEDPALVAFTLQAVVNEILATEERVDALLSGGALERVAQTLWLMAHPSNAEGRTLKLTNERLAALVGASPQTVSACLSKLEKRSIITHCRGRIVILSAERLQAFAGRGA